MSSRLFATVILGFMFLLEVGCQSKLMTPTVIDSTIPPAQTTTPVILFTPDAEITTTVSRKTALPGDSIIKNQCPKVASQQLNNISTGDLLVFDRSDMTFSYLNLLTGNILPAENAVISPSRSRIAYWGLNENDLSSFLVVKTIGENPVLPKWPNLGIGMSSWLDDERLIFRLYKNLQGPPPIDPPPYEIAIFNPFTGVTKKLTPDFPGISTKEVDWNFSGPAYYDDTLDYVLYAKWDNPKNMHEYALYRISTKTSIASLRGSSYNSAYLYDGNSVTQDGVSANPPQWSSDNTRVAVISPALEKPDSDDEIFAITKNGDVQRLTYFARYFDKVKISDLSWSPNGKSLAFWVTLTPSPFKPPENAYQDMRLAILNTETLEISIYCIDGDNIGLKHSAISVDIAKTVSAPIWSPDGSQLVIENRFATNSSRLIVLDLASSKAVQIGQDMKPLGWMTDLPK